MGGSNYRLLSVSENDSKCFYTSLRRHYAIASFWPKKGDNVKKKNGAILFLVLVVGLLCAGFAAADKTIAGTIYDSDGVTPVEGAEVHIECRSSVNTWGTADKVSEADGTYAEEFPGSGDNMCRKGHTSYVSASKDGKSGEASSLVGEDDVTYIDVTLENSGGESIPEFSAITMGIAGIGAIAGYSFLRRKKLWGR